MVLYSNVEQNLDGTAILQEPLGSLLLLIDQEDVNTIHYEGTTIEHII